MRWLTYLLAAVGAYTLISIITAPIVGRWLAQQDGSDEFGIDLDALAAVDVPVLSDTQVDRLFDQIISDRSHP
jgi:hypothetical protein